MVSILMVDDDAAFRRAASRALRAAGHLVEEAANGDEALKLLAARPSDVLLTDIIMPGGDGIELIAAVKKAHPAVRIIAMTGRANFGAVDLLSLATMIGADATLAKPLDTDDILGAIATVMGPGSSLSTGSR